MVKLNRVTRGIKADKILLKLCDSARSTQDGFDCCILHTNCPTWAFLPLSVTLSGGSAACLTARCKIQGAA